MERRDVVESVSWGSMGHRERYVQLLENRVRIGWITAAVIGVGALILLLWAEYFTEGDLIYRATIFTMLAAMFVVIVISLLLHLHHIDTKLHHIEIFFQFHERRGEVRHELYCKSALHCLALHFLIPTPKDTSST